MIAMLVSVRGLKMQKKDVNYWRHPTLIHNACLSTFSRLAYYMLKYQKYASAGTFSSNFHNWNNDRMMLYLLKYTACDEEIPL